MSFLRHTATSSFTYDDKCYNKYYAHDETMKFDLYNDLYNRYQNDMKEIQKYVTEIAAVFDESLTINMLVKLKTSVEEIKKIANKDSTALKKLNEVNKNYQFTRLDAEANDIAKKCLPSIDKVEVNHDEILSKEPVPEI